jgi:hypothetical protein
VQACSFDSLLGVVTSNDITRDHICKNSVYMGLFVSHSLNINVAKVCVLLLVETFLKHEIDVYTCETLQMENNI